MRIAPPTKPGTFEWGKIQFMRNMCLTTVLFGVVVAQAVGSDTAIAKPPAETYVFQLFKVEMAKGVPPEIETEVRRELTKAIESRAELHPNAGEGAPDPEREPKEFERHLKSKHMRAFKVNVEVTGYESTVKDEDAKHYVAARITLRLFGETIPGRTFAFVGDGSATTKVEIGKKVRPRDQEYASTEAVKAAVEDAINSSIQKLRAPPEKPGKKPGKKKVKKG
jgi:hypothetical protein